MPADELKPYWDELKRRTDGHNWYWLSYGETCYAFAVVTAFPIEKDGASPPAGGRLDRSMDEARVWLSEDGTRMLTDDWIANVEQQNGDCVCKFIAQAFADAQRRFDIQDPKEPMPCPPK